MKIKVFVAREIQYSELGTRGFELATRGFQLVTRRFKLATRGFELATRVLVFHI